MVGVLEVDVPTLRLAMFSLLYPSSRVVLISPSCEVVSPPKPDEKSRSCDTRGRLKLVLFVLGAVVRVCELLFTWSAELGMLEVSLLPLATWLDVAGITVKKW